MLTEIEATKARDRLRQALALISAARVIYADAGCVPGIRNLNGIAGLLDEEISTLTQIIVDSVKP